MTHYYEMIVTIKGYVHKHQMAIVEAARANWGD